MLRRDNTRTPPAVDTGTIKIRDGMASIACAILDFSDNGACILVSDGAAIPAAFLLSVDGTKATHACVVMWRTRNRIGVHFDPHPPRKLS
jgi:hypothetical protein